MSMMNMAREQMPTRPVLSEDEAFAIGNRILELSTADEVRIRIEHDAIGVTRVNRTQAFASQDRETVRLMLSFTFGERSVGAGIAVNQLDDDTLRVIVPYLEAIAKEQVRPVANAFKGMYNAPTRPLLPVQLWHETTVDALAEIRTKPLAEMMEATQRAGLVSAVFIGAIARAACVVTSRGQKSYTQQTDAEVAVTCWSSDGRASGWGGSAAREWNALDPQAAMHDAIDIAKRSANAEALEPGRRTAILGPAAVAQLVAQMGYAFNAVMTIRFGQTPFSLPDRSNPVGRKVFDERITMVSDPADPDGGYRPFILTDWGFRPEDGMPQGAHRWVEQGVLKKLQYDPVSAATMGVSDASERPQSFRLETTGETATLEEMISSCRLGIYVNRLSGVFVSDRPSGMMSGTTTGGCFLVKDGKLDRPLKNFRFVDSPFFSLNSLEMIGRARRTALGYMSGAGLRSWPLDPIIVPPLMVRDFNFAALADVV